MWRQGSVFGLHAATCFFISMFTDLFVSNFHIIRDSRILHQWHWWHKWCGILWVKTVCRKLVQNATQTASSKIELYIGYSSYGEFSIHGIERQSILATASDICYFRLPFLGEYVRIVSLTYHWTCYTICDPEAAPDQKYRVPCQLRNRNHKCDLWIDFVNHKSHSWK